MTIATYTKTGTASSTKTSLPKSLGLPSSNDLLHQTYSSQTANSRIRTAHTKKRGEVRGGGRKPWVQKGTGRARAGSIRSPIWRGGGVVFGPQDQRNYGRKINKSSARLALAQALKLAETESRIKVIDDIKADGKTKSVKALLDKIQFSSGLIIDAEPTAELKQALANLPGVRGVAAANLSSQMVLEAREMLFTKDGLGSVIQRLEAKS